MLNTQGNSKNKACYIPGLGDRQRDSPPFLNPWLPYTSHWEKRCFWQIQDFEKQGELTLLSSIIPPSMRPGCARTNSTANKQH